MLASPNPIASPEQRDVGQPGREISSPRSCRPLHRAVVLEPDGRLNGVVIVWVVLCHNVEIDAKVVRIALDPYPKPLGDCPVELYVGVPEESGIPTALSASHVFVPILPYLGTRFVRWNRAKADMLLFHEGNTHEER